MTKFPVWATVEDAYIYVSHHAGDILRRNWPLLLICLVLGYGMNLLSLYLVAHKATLNYGSFSLSLLPYFLLTLMNSYYVAAYMAAVVRSELGLPALKKGWVPFRNGDAIYIFGINLGIGLISVAYISGVVLVLSLASILAPAFRPEFLYGGGCVAFVVWIYAMLRVSWMIVPLVVSGKREILKNSWALDGGNAARILGLVVLLSVPLFLVQEILMFFGGYISVSLLPVMAAGGLIVARLIISLAIMFITFTLCARAQARCYQFAGAESSNAAE